MKKYFGISVLYPKYPIRIVTPSGSKIRFGTRVIYVDVPAEIYKLYELWWKYYNESIYENKKNLLDKIKVLEEHIKEVLKEYSDLYRISRPTKISWAKRPYIQLRIKWDRFLEYLDNKVTWFINEAKKRDTRGASSLLTQFYNETIIGNYFALTGTSDVEKSIKYIIEHAKKNDFEIQRLNFSKLLLRIGELGIVNSLLRRLERAVVKSIESYSMELSDKVTPGYISWSQMALAHMYMNLSGINKILNESISVIDMVLHLRKFIENFVRTLSFYRGLRTKEYESYHDPPGYFYCKFYKEKIYVNSKDLKKKLNLSPRYAADLSKIYSIVSEMIHKISPLPFYSVLEFKLFREIIRWLVETIEDMAGIKQVREEATNFWQALALEESAAKDALKLVRYETSKIVALVCESLYELDRLYINSLYILSNLMPMEKYIRNGYIVENDFINIIKEISSKLRGLNALELSLGLDGLEKLRDLLAKRIIKSGILKDYSLDYIKKVAFYIVLLSLRDILKKGTM